MQIWRTSRREALLAAGAAAVIHWPRRLIAMTHEWLPISPGEAGFAPDLEARLDKFVADGRVWNLHGLVVLRNDRLVLERYFEGVDRVRGIGDVGRVIFKSDTMHDLRSCSKSIIGLLYGIALQQGIVPAPETSLFSAFPEYADLANKDGRDRLNIEHVLTMTMGTDWDESSLLYSDPCNSETAMDNAPDRYRYILERRVVDTPGVHWTYCGGATALLGRIIAKGSSKKLHDFARENLFDPLGMGRTEWATSPDGEPFAASGARMSVRDLARIGIDAAWGQGRRSDYRASRLDEAVHYPGRQRRRNSSLWLSVVRARYRFRQAQRLGGRAAGADVDGTGRRWSAVVRHSRVAVSHRHHRRKLSERRPMGSPNASTARINLGEHIVTRRVDGPSRCRSSALSGHGATSDLIPLCAPKRTPPTTTDLWVHALGDRRRVYGVICPGRANHLRCPAPFEKIIRLAVC